MDQGPGVSPAVRKESGLIKLALFGWPIKSSLSPAIHRLFAGQFGLEIEYQRFETGTDGFPGKLDDFRHAGGIGCNVTLPLKEDAWRLAGGATTQANQAQAANTLVFQPASGWFAHNTDGAGLMADLTVNHAFELSGQRILIIGAGGAAAGILGDLLAGGTREIVLLNRSEDRARALAERFSTVGKITVVRWQDLPALGSFKLVINATSLGHHGEAPALTKSVFASGALCYDLNYHAASRSLRKLCEDMGQDYIDGLGMLVEQAAKSFNIWTGYKPDSRVVIRTVGQAAQP